MFARNIDTSGRLLRAAFGLAFAVGAVATWPHSLWAAAALFVGAAFLFFEAARGWCAARACGIRTRV